MDADGTSPRNLTQDPAQDVHPAWSPDGRRIAFVSSRSPSSRCKPGPGPCWDACNRQSEIYVMNADGSRKRNLTRRANDDYPTWSPDGRRIAFLRATGSYRHHGYHLYVVNADGSGLRNLMQIAAVAYFSSHLVWSPDGRTIYFGRYLISTDGSGARKLPYIPLIAVWSPDGRQIAFVGNRATGLPGPGARSKDDSEIYVMNADGSGTRRLTHNVGYDGEPAWSPDGRKIAFQSHRRCRGQQGGDLRHERRRKRKAEPHPEPGKRRQSLLVAGRAEDRVCQQPRRATRSSRHERRRERSEESGVTGGIREVAARAFRRSHQGRTGGTIQLCLGRGVRAAWRSARWWPRDQAPALQHFARGWGGDGWIPASRARAWLAANRVRPRWRK